MELKYDWSYQDEFEVEQGTTDTGEYIVKNLKFFPGFFPYQKGLHPFIVKEGDPAVSWDSSPHVMGFIPSC